MKLLNLGCGGHRPQSEQWWNLDCLRTFLHPGTPERTNLDAEPRYVEHTLLKDGPMPWVNGTFAGILCQHVIEHFSCFDAVKVLEDCRRLLKEGGVLCVSVPDCVYFLDNYNLDTRDNAVNLFGEPISEPQYQRFFDYALFQVDHKQVLNHASLSCLLLKAGFNLILNYSDGRNPAHEYPLYKELNRKKFSTILCAYK